VLIDVCTWKLPQETAPEPLPWKHMGEKGMEGEGRADRGVNVCACLLVCLVLLVHYLPSYQQNAVIPLCSHTPPHTHTHTHRWPIAPLNGICECVRMSDFYMRVCLLRGNKGDFF